ncbi:MAG: PIN domain-containing protein [Candidatus Electryonea clarkiae]|nr:PIN domain-containing protein [Candidatus Electryonea clarkiae]MDP8285085.1 PIN domain-containing protein [Candidatus Electryonea clarkiae]
MRAYIDSDILIWHLRGEEKAYEFLRQLRDSGEYELWTGAMQRAEIVFFMRPEEENMTMLFLSQFKTDTVDQTIVDDAAVLFKKWNPGYGIDVNDALLAASAKRSGGRIFTINTKHFPMPDIFVSPLW